MSEEEVKKMAEHCQDENVSALVKRIKQLDQKLRKICEEDHELHMEYLQAKDNLFSGERIDEIIMDNIKNAIENQWLLRMQTMEERDACVRECKKLLDKVLPKNDELSSRNR